MYQRIIELIGIIRSNQQYLSTKKKKNNEHGN